MLYTLVGQVPQEIVAPANCERVALFTAGMPFASNVIYIRMGEPTNIVACLYFTGTTMVCLSVPRNQAVWATQSGNAYELAVHVYEIRAVCE